MLRCLRKKLHSENGASIMVALLLFLVCGMVAASILAAALSNAGKIRSNRAEQQKYLTLSSAILLVADEIQEMRYTWQYTVYEWEEAAEDGGTEYCFSCWQDEGEYEGGDLLSQIPLNKWLNGELRRQFPSGEGGAGYKPLENPGSVSLVDTGASVCCTLLVTLPEDLEGYPSSGSGSYLEVYGVPREVCVKVEMSHATRYITLTAWLKSDSAESGPPPDGSDTMTAELMAEGEAPFLGYGNPEGREGKDTLPSPDADGEGDEDEAGDGSSGMTELIYHGTMNWKLNWIRKGVS